MALPAKRIPESVAHLDIEIVAAALIRHDANIRNAARALGVPSGDLRKLVLVDQRLADAALEAVELRLDDAEANLSEALHCGDPRRRDAVSMFMLRNMQRASKRGYAVAASAASLEMNIDTPPTQYIVVWGRPTSPDRELGQGEFGAMGRDFSAATMAAMRRDDDVFRGRACPAGAMIEHAAAVASEPEPAARRRWKPVSTAARTGVRRRPLRARADRRLDSQPPHRLSARLLFALSYADHRGAGLAGGVERRGEGAFSSGLPRRMAY